MAIRISVDDRPIDAWVARNGAAAMALVLMVALVARVAAMGMLHEAIESDAASYLEMARTILGPDPMRDAYGNAAFYSPGYPFALSAMFAVAGIGVGSAQVANLLLGLAATWLVQRLTLKATGDRLAALLAAAGYAVLIPAVAGAALLQRENLSVPLLLAFVLAVLHLPETTRPRRVAAIAGLLYGIGVLGGASVVLTAAAAALALWWRRDRWRTPIEAGLVFLAAAALPIVPWLVHVDRQLGRPVLTTNAPFNLYVGNNPAATGRFVSLRDTPVARSWHPIRDTRGELAATDWLGGLAKAYIVAHPGATAALAVKKLALFWLPDPPSRDGGVVALLRLVDIVQQSLILAAALVCIAGWRRQPRAARLVIMTIGLFWAIHAAAYVMPRYRQPAMPLMLVLAAGAVAPLLRRTRNPRMATA